MILGNVKSSSDQSAAKIESCIEGRFNFRIDECQRTGNSCFDEEGIDACKYCRTAIYVRTDAAIEVFREVNVVVDICTHSSGQFTRH